ncbi:MAG: hypothetical protein ACXAEF_12555 [Candidatus Thorarchaeota archaeon]|jgi:O-antigen/teichoic acid export membrane protein
MQRYNMEIRRILVMVVIVAALLASAVLVAALFSEQPFINERESYLLPLLSIPIGLGIVIIMMVLLVNRHQ